MKTVYSVLAVAGALFASTQALAGLYDELTPDQKAAVQKGQQVFITKDANQAWPKTWVYQRVEGTPEEAMAMFADYELQSKYVPSLSKSKISKRLNKTVCEVDYTLDIPWPLSDENYTVRDTLSSYDNGASYKVEWTLVRADSTESIQGYMRAETLGTGTLLGYYNYVVPGGALAGFAKNQAMKQVRDTVNAIASQLRTERAQNQPLLQRQVQSLRASLSR